MINMVTEERGKLTGVAKELLSLLDTVENVTQEDQKQIEIRNRTLDLLKHLSNMAGFCDKASQDKIKQATEHVTTWIGGSANIASLRKVCTMAVTLQVDFNKSPFAIVDSDVDVLTNEFRNTFKK